MTVLPLVSLTFLTLVAFAANSVFCRLALDEQNMDPMSFTGIRLTSAALVLGVIMLVKSPATLRSFSALNAYGSWRQAGYLFAYAAGFSYAYVTLPTATGALILFAAVQFTMLLVARFSGHRMSALASSGVVISLVGFVYFVLPELSSPSLIGLMVMALAGVAWGMYSLAGAKSTHALESTSANFIRCLPLGLVLMAVFMPTASLTFEGVAYALASGALASGIGYAIWYQVLSQLDSSVAAVCQLSVPIIAAFGGVLLVDEPITAHLMLSSIAILGGMLLVILGKKTKV
ncbi:DMT family transporter [Paraglaciecola sp. L1A13]|uniref:DMT family transporter n=1 Tax=Paraglaciecola sp. L1A13 TaxID=2686359 RepID=UPI00131BCD8C|nr:DMT family transporter [Paraglaciecola sp. L1A13]